MKSWMFIEYRIEHGNRKGVYAYFVKGFMEMARHAARMADEGLVVVEGSSLRDECDVTQYANDKGCVVIIDQSDFGV